MAAELGLSVRPALEEDSLKNMEKKKKKNMNIREAPPPKKKRNFMKKIHKTATPPILLL